MAMSEALEIIDFGDSKARTDTEHLAINNETGYRSFRAGGFTFTRDEYFARLTWPGGSHIIPIDAFLRAMMRDVAWGFFYGVVNFDHVFGTINHYGEVTMFAGRFNDAYRNAGRDHEERFKSSALMAVFKDILSDWTVEGYDPFAAPMETGLPWGIKNGNNDEAISRQRVTARRMVGLPGDTPVRTDANGFPVNRQFADVPQEQPVVEAEPGFEAEVSAYNLFGYLSRSDVTWNPSVCSVVGDSLFCPTSEEFILPVEHGNDRCEWFLQLSDEIVWDVKDKESGKPRARVTARAGDICCMPADIRHQGYSTKRSMLLVWENGSPKIPQMIADGTAPVVPVTF
ncbi:MULTISPECIES: hydroxyquinol 1,2-dioxygenase [Sphingobium]|uniref:Hydroquinone dioxygenase large subunit n=4 Tax=Sphingomonadaceae TaxID=41297 RepID=A0A292GLC6_9SPHN|nr:MULTISPECIES: hydroxyquinol 1,2-dioxygenase [Sphingobium]5M21_B Chain B, Hydroquinone dioxygenase large subunit [Sphingomonas sp. TTNP3]5M21_D Chain D, Hydroquinone dioxygenase large subunit [Sphingomonas sp. TTNP3]5M21_F Chain F, Hydroquinone dioxygenase large subunit [Sphingomonas sp. TTNP3]5M21_H Chain H, Hydroquinone dioxygenase large subunit [Sphingomonas sp. TTNP3]5M22_B Chain B, Hydroquinone dioxygenase large subunit [Sphingomonas sp. TTNP3]5M22_D Chain D, Hydroquinone dioxygenase l